MKIIMLIVALMFIPLYLFSCQGHTTHTLSSLSGSEIFVGYDRKTIEHMIDCGITHHCADVRPMELLLQHRLFCAEDGTKVAVLEGFSFSPVRKIRILQGIHTGEVGWVSEQMLK